MGIFRDLSRLVPNEGARSIAKKVGKATDRVISHWVYEADRNTYFAEAEQSGKRITPAEFLALPMTLEELVASPYNDLRTPVNTAALFVLALNAFSQNRDESIAMINYLRGPNPMSAEDVRLLDETLVQNNTAGYLARSYLMGATQHNGYTPSQPYTVIVIDNPYTYLDTNVVHEYAYLFVQCGVTDSPRAVTMRKGEDGLWYLWKHFLFDDIPPSVRYSQHD